MLTDDYHTLPSFVKNISGQCSDHKKNLEMYCSFHACPCCVQCVTDKHQKCQDMKPLADIIKHVKSSASVQLLEKDLKDLQENFEEVIKHLKKRINTNNIQKTKAIEEISYMRMSINDYLNKLEEEILEELKCQHSKLEFEINTLLERMEHHANQIGHLQGEFSKMKQYATELQMYVGLREIEKTTSKAAKYIDDLENGGQFSDKNLEVNISPVLQSVLQGVKSLGDIRIQIGSSTLQLNAGRKDQAQYFIPDVPGIDQIKPTLLRKLTIPHYMKSIQIYASAILPDGRFSILDYTGKRLLLFSNEGILMKEVVTLTGYPIDCCFVIDNTMAVTLGSSNHTALVDVEKGKIIQTIKLSNYCNGVASDGQIVVISSDQKSTKVNLNDMSLTILEEVKARHISLFKGNIYGTNSNENKVLCYTSTGESLWTFQHHDIDCPIRLALDMHGFVYISYNENNSIVVVSPDGQTCKTILTEDDGIESPFAIDINREIRMMIVSSTISDDSCDNSYQTVFVYKI